MVSSQHRQVVRGLVEILPRGGSQSGFDALLELSERKSPFRARFDQPVRRGFTVGVGDSGSA